MAKTPRKWTGARSPSGLKRVRTAERRHAILGPRRAAAKTFVKNAVAVATVPTDGDDPQVALAEAISALDLAAKVGAIHPNAAARRKSRLAVKVNALLAGAGVTGGRVAKTVGKAAAQKAARARIAASKADKAKGAQTAAGKARAALSRTARSEAAAAAAAAAPSEATPAKKAATKPSSTAAKVKTAAPKATKTAATKAKAAASKTATAKTATTKAATKPIGTAKATAKPAAKKTTKPA